MPPPLPAPGARAGPSGRHRRAAPVSPREREPDGSGRRRRADADAERRAWPPPRLSCYGAETMRAAAARPPPGQGAGAAARAWGTPRRVPTRRASFLWGPRLGPGPTSNIPAAPSRKFAVS
ncbi:putative uncharacterized protein FLJ13197 [Herpailurus yagouaroundi]|uniref:putative uncharacterized protein FLJ13197 n=1 Tax=Herpailurus yagouaroundi TaxID=1608482 RepID=UPI001AD6DEEE|nr:putative uncharacterized protein FLJ13197 [Puma yagouaroundi]